MSMADRAMTNQAGRSAQTRTIEPTKKKGYDVIVVGSGAAGGMAAFQPGRSGEDEQDLISDF
jgi:alkyl hydroperoxide reductase subunit AhpF